MGSVSVSLVIAVFALASGFSSEARAGNGTLVTEPKSQKSATPTPTPKAKPTPNEEEEEIRANHRFLGEPARTAKPVRTTMFVGREIAVPTDYSAPRIYSAPDGSQVIQPSSPRSFTTRKTGVTLNSGGGFEQTELEGFIDYGTPIRTIVPVYNEKGEFVGTAVQEHPNPILQPVFRTIRR
jgi:hypothetical protein